VLRGVDAPPHEDHLLACTTKTLEWFRVPLSTREILASANPYKRPASAHVLAADSDYSLVKELSRKIRRHKTVAFSSKTPATALAMALVRLPTIPYPASLP